MVISSKLRNILYLGNLDVTSVIFVVVNELAEAQSWNMDKPQSFVFLACSRYFILRKKLELTFRNYRVLLLRVIFEVVTELAEAH